ncbi:MAG TPA: GNAT family N-acetyltransferase [Saprospiraceae bacterium]|nr:GNAT family N-acetyltransferase [Saprospiraceae bacterium]
MIIRKYQDSDKERVLELLRLNTPEYFSPTEEKDLISYLDNHSDNYYVVELDNSIFCCGGLNSSDDPEIVKISWDIVHPQSQRKGIGSVLLKFRIQKIKEMEGVRTISVRTSQLAYPFYARFGFETTEIVKDFWAEGFDLYRMECDLNSI